MRALVLTPHTPHRALSRTPQARLIEAVGLARAIDLDVVEAQVVSLPQPKPATYFGLGKVEEFAVLILEKEIGLVIVDSALTPVQQRNLERDWKAKVIDRTGLILDIFGRRASTREGSLQVELAHLSYQKSRLVRSWTHLERQRGGFGFLGGPGETQIEVDRRLIQERMTRIEEDLKHVRRTRGLHRESRQRVPYPVVALVGYTNAGKSTLFNTLTKASVLAKDMLFATLDPTARVVKMPHGESVILSDTVGFISDLPTTLIAAFRATLEEVITADVIVHVRDIASEQTDAEAADVAHVLQELGIDGESQHRFIEVWNKADLLPEPPLRADGKNAPILVSALTGEGVDTFMQALEAKIAVGRTTFRLLLNENDGAERHWLYTQTEVLERRAHPEKPGQDLVVVRVHPIKEPRLLARFPNARRM
jgi:GTPase